MTDHDYDSEFETASESDNDKAYLSESETYMAKIYKLYYKNKPKMLYIGSTTVSLSRRLSQHRYDSTRKNSKLYEFMRKYGAENFEIQLIDEVEIENERELRLCEQLSINLLKPKLNEVRAFCTPEQYTQQEKVRNERKRLKRK